jgi:N6-L-threonylcarbamoyladenine synthase
MIVLGIETSCDETGIAIINDNYEILSHVLYSQIDLHAVYGGVVPEVASRSHIEKIDILFEQALKEANLTLNDIDIISATAGPGLMGGLLIGTTFAKALAWATDKPYIAVNHLQGHALMSRLTHQTQYPFLLLLTSGGHCQIVKVDGINDFAILGTTIDDAAGEAFDKVAKLLGYEYPGGGTVDRLAKLGNEKRFAVPLPLINDDSCNFSFSGMKSAVRNIVAKGEIETEQDQCDLCASFQTAVCKCMEKKVERALKETGLKTLVVSGGVARNSQVRETLTRLAEKLGVEIHIPDPKLCTDNGVMIAIAGLENAKAGSFSKLTFRPRPRWSLEDLRS